MNLKKFLKNKTLIKTLRKSFGSHHGPNWAETELELTSKPILTINSKYIPILGLHNKITNDKIMSKLKS